MFVGTLQEDKAQDIGLAFTMSFSASLPFESHSKVIFDMQKDSRKNHNDIVGKKKISWA